jgi:GNAT superfamily N-acetyltransferase
VEYLVLDWHGAGPDGGGARLRLDHREFAYAGKFVSGAAGLAVVVPDGVDPGTVATDGEAYADVIGAASFDEDRTDPDVLRVRYVTVRRDRRGEGIGSRLLAFVAAAGHDREYPVVRIAVNNPFAYEASYRAGFGWTGRETGIAELVCDHPDPTDRDPGRYRAGLDLFRERGAGDPEASFLADRADADPPAVVRSPRWRGP